MLNCGLDKGGSDAYGYSDDDVGGGIKAGVGYGHVNSSPLAIRVRSDVLVMVVMIKLLNVAAMVV